MLSEQGMANFEEKLWAMVMRLSHRHFSDAVARVSDYDLPPTSWTLLEFLARSRPVRVSEIAEYSGIDISSVTPRLQALQDSGLIERRASPDDGRVALITIGETGRDAVDQIHRTRQAMLSEAMTGMSESEVETTTRVLDQLVERLDSSRYRYTDGPSA